MKVQILDNPFFGMEWGRDIPLLIQKLTEKSFEVFSGYISFFMTFGLIWLPWIIHEDLGIMLEVIKNSFFPTFYKSTPGIIGFGLFLY